MILGAHNMGAQIKGFYRVVSVRASKLFVSYDIRGKVIHFYLRFLYVDSTYSGNKGISKVSKQKVVKSY